ncbi:MAG: hypothetical protein LBU32_02915 [Clostridiales bacterium]|jgi:hypothetical protein|nr:hypothetical protein [Clostridiales bacterium]
MMADFSSFECISIDCKAVYFHAVPCLKHKSDAFIFGNPLELLSENLLFPFVKSQNLGAGEALPALGALDYARQSLDRKCGLASAPSCLRLSISSLAHSNVAMSMMASCISGTKY